MEDECQFDHFLITRFNVRMERRATADWLRHRLNFFRDVCRPSIRSQTTKSFRWLVYFDAERDDWFEEEINRLAAGTFEAVWLDGQFTVPSLALDLAGRASKPWLITSRVDNDDALARDYVETVQRSFKCQDTQFINFQSGIQFSTAGRAYHRLDPSNAFISLVERRKHELPMTVYVDSHDRVSLHAPVMQVRDHPMWLQMVHGENLGNVIRGIRARPDVVDLFFDLDLSAAPVHRVHLLAAQLATSVMLARRVLGKPHRIVWLARVIKNRLGRRAA